MTSPTPQDGASGPVDGAVTGAEPATSELFAALGDAGLHLLQPPFDLAQALAACTGPGEVIRASMRWSTARMDLLLADQARLMAAFLALAAASDQTRGTVPHSPPG